MSAEYKAVYISPVVEKGDDRYCVVEEVIGKNAGKKYAGNYIYHKSVFGDTFHGTLIMFCKDNVQIKDTQEILQNFDVKLVHVKALNLETFDFYASDGVLYNLEDNYFSRHNKQTFENMKKDLEKCSSFYILLVVERSSGRIIDITLVVNPQSSQKYPYKYRIVKGLVTPDIQELKKIGQKASGSGRKTDEKMTQDDIDQLIEDFYAKDLNIRLQ